jgi:hypothetical protein
VIEAPLPVGPPVATFEGMIAIGDASAAEVTKLLERESDRLAICLGVEGPTTTELTVLVVNKTLALRNAWQDGASVRIDCLQRSFPGAQIESDSKTTSVYVVVKAEPPGATAPATPRAPDRRADFQALYCDLPQLSGADKVEASKRLGVMREWAKQHVRHPAALELANKISKHGPVGLKEMIADALRSEGITTCAMQGMP